jgi:hypothetical protein
MLEQIDVIDPILLHVIREPIVLNMILESWSRRGRSTHQFLKFLNFLKFLKNPKKHKLIPARPS